MDKEICASRLGFLTREVARSCISGSGKTKG